MAAPFDLAHAPPIGVPERLAPGLRVVTARNAGPMTFTGTRSYIVGDGEVAVIDPGPDDSAHREALVAAVAGERVMTVLVTHAHLDHSGGAREFARQVGAVVVGHGDPEGGRSPTMARLAAAGGLGGGEGIDPSFRPHFAIGDGFTIQGPDWTLTALATPGHTADHLSFAWEEAGALFSGDLVMGWATTVISPPDGDLAAFRASLGRLRARDDRVYFPGHGAPVAAPGALIDHILAHRQGREDAILAGLAAGPQGLGALVARVYHDVAAELWPAAARNLLAHLIDLEERGLVTADLPPGPAATFRLAGSIEQP